MPTFTETSYIEAVWYVAGEGFDVLGNVYQDAPGQAWRAYYRFRYYNPESVNPFDQKDRKSSYSATAVDGSSESRDKLSAAFDFVFGCMAESMKSVVQKVVIRGDSEAFQREMSKRAWAHIKKVPMPKTTDTPQ